MEGGGGVGNRQCKKGLAHHDFKHIIANGLKDSEEDESTVLVTILRACARSRDTCKGTKLHEEIARRGLVRNCSDALVAMYAKCGALGKAKELFDLHKSRDVLTWTALIAGCAQNGQGQEALEYFHRMQSEGYFPDAVTYSCILKACGSIGAAEKGGLIHDEISKQGLLEKDIVLGNALIDMYAKCNVLVKARRVLEELPVRNVISWTALIAGYAEQGENEQALKCFEQMQSEGLLPNATTFVCILKACGSIGAADKGEQIHNEIEKEGLLVKNPMLGNALVNMYAKCGALGKAQKCLEELPIQDASSWTALIVGYAKHGQSEQALDTFQQMKRKGLSPDPVTFVCVLKACVNVQAVDLGKRIHQEIVEEGLFGTSIVLGTALVDMYAKCGAFAEARRVLDELPVRDGSTWAALIMGCVEQGEGEEALDCFDHMQIEGLPPDAVTLVFVLNACGSTGAADKGKTIHDEILKQMSLIENVPLATAVVDMYVKCGNHHKARQLVEELPVRNVISWTAVISGFAEHGEGEQALDCFKCMQREGLFPNPATYACVLKACSHVKAVGKGELFHAEIIKGAFMEGDVVLGTALVDMYAKCNALAKARRVFEELPASDVICWTALIAGCSEHGEGEHAWNFLKSMECEGLYPNAVTFVSMLKACGSTQDVCKGEIIHDTIAVQGLLGNDIVLGNSLVCMYARCHNPVKAQEILEKLPARDVCTWTALIAGYAGHGEGKQALNCFEQMQHEGLLPDAMTFLCLSKACGSLGAIDKGEEIYEEVAKQGLLGKNVLLGTALVDMYAKCGALEKAQGVLEELSGRNVISWNALIAGYARHGQSVEALNCLKWMQSEGLSPDAATFSFVLSACSHLGMVEAGLKCFGDIAMKFGTKPDPEHYTCMIDLFSRVGHLDKAVQVIDKIPCTCATWSALLGACSKWGDEEVGRWAFEHAVEEHAVAV